MARKNKLTSRDRGYIADVVANVKTGGRKTLKEIGLDNGFPLSMAQSPKSNIERKFPGVIEFQTLLHELTPIRAIAEVLAECMKATKTISVGDGGTLEIPDYRERREAAVAAARFLGVEVSKVDESVSNSGPASITINLATVKTKQKYVLEDTKNAKK